MGDGFTTTEQSIFVETVKNAANYLIGNEATGDAGFYPYNLFRDYFTIYAIKVISEESGVSRDSDENTGQVVNNYFGSSFYEGNDNSNFERGLVISNRARVIELQKEYSAMTVIICNSKRYGGSATDIAVISLSLLYKQILTHELGHALGKLADEYFVKGEKFKTYEAVNKTQDGSLNTNKWKHWIGKSGIYSGIGIYRISNDPADVAYNWYRPHQFCQMQFSNQPFCAVCIEALITKMEEKTGSFFDISNISDTEICINDVNYKIYNTFEIPPLIDGKKVVKIGSGAFENQTELKNVIIHNGVTIVGSFAYKNCSSLTSVTIPESVTIDCWGYVTSTGPTCVMIEGIYCLNPRVKLLITLNITE